MIWHKTNQLTDSLFADPKAKDAFLHALVSAETLDVPLRFRLFIDPGAHKLHSLRWESLYNPKDDSLLCTNENLYFSRYLIPPDFRPVRLRLKDQMRALVLVSNPTDLEDNNLPPIAVMDELDNIERSLGNIPMNALPNSDLSQRSTIDNLLEHLRQREHDILVLVCHGTIDSKGEPRLWLEDDNGRSDRISGNELVERLNELVKIPSLVVLASCQSAGKSAGSVRNALGPQIVDVGIPAVVAMHGNITMETTDQFLPVFFNELQVDGVIDRALAVARGTVRHRPDYWMPVLYMRLEKGSIWSGFTDPKAFRKWPALVSNIQSENCTPILGSGLVDPLIGSYREISQRWAKEYEYPMFPHERDSLPQVAQYLSIDQDKTFPRRELERHVRSEIQQRYQTELPDELREPKASLNELINTVGVLRRKRVPWDAYGLLASLDLPVFITTNFNNLLENALIDLGKKPESEIYPWNKASSKVESIYTREPGYDPTPERPLVYHLFGRLDIPESVVLSEDDYFKYLSEFPKELPSKVAYSLTSTALLFLGFQLDDWNFRVLLSSLLSLEGSARREQFAHVAVQIEPEADRLLVPNSARRYLEDFYKESFINLYWGNAEDFVKELHSYLPEKERMR